MEHENPTDTHSSTRTTTTLLADFDSALARHSLGPLRRGQVTTLQVNVGFRCNQACTHCHVEAGPKRTEEMSEAVARRVLELVATNPGVTTVDLTGGAPELNTHFRWLVTEVRALGRTVIDRCNLTILSEPGQEDLADFLASRGVHVVASLPCYGRENVDAQRGRGVFERSIEGLRQLNALGYGQAGAGLRLDLVYNPGGPFLPPPQGTLEARYKTELAEQFGIVFDRLLTITNMPIKRFSDDLHRRGETGRYLALLVAHFNPATVEALMCRSLVSIGWDGGVYDCDFHQMCSIGLGASRGGPTATVFDLDLQALAGAPVATVAHCFGCTAGAGSSCGGALEPAVAEAP